ncbi:UDP-glycosyltransferase UGT5-like [Culex pipiens pallens]|nr:UDP-glycosyltransferase UGT5-like [Culex pipiens pallens]
MDSCALLALALLGLVCSSEGAKILGILPTAGKSHYIIGAAYMKTLAEAGHEVTVISPFPLKNPPKHYRDIELTGMLEAAAGQDEDMFKYKGSGFGSFAIMLMVLYGMFPEVVCKFVLQHPNVVELLKSDEKFDLVIAETFLTESLYGFAQHFDAPLITYSTFGNSMWTNDLVGTPAPPSHVAHFLLSFADQMSFWERLGNVAATIVDRLAFELYYLPVQKQMYKEGFPNAKISFEEQMQNVSLVFLNQHFSVSSPRPYAPNMIEVGGIQVEKPKALPEDLQKYLDEAEHGVIYFCMGSNLKSKFFPEEKRNAFLKVFSTLKERVLWKFEDETLPNQPGNVKIQAWMPQNDILAHPKVKLFITHGGLLGTSESLTHGKPMVGIPIFGDQMMNVEKGVRAGYSYLLDYDDITEESVAKAINTVLGTPSYTKTAQLISQRFRDRPLTAQQTAVYWVDYVIRHGGAPHLRSPAMDLSLLQYKLLDVYVVLLAIIMLIASLNFYIAKVILRKLFKSKKAKGNKQKRS